MASINFQPAAVKVAECGVDQVSSALKMVIVPSVLPHKTVSFFVPKTDKPESVLNDPDSEEPLGFRQVLKPLLTYLPCLKISRTLPNEISHCGT
jgi:hypothetical protein